MKFLLWAFSVIFLLLFFGEENFVLLVISISLGAAAYLQRDKGAVQDKTIDSKPAPSAQEIATNRLKELHEHSKHKPLLAVHVGGSGFTLKPQEVVFLSTRDDTFVISNALSDNDLPLSFAEIISVEVSGPGSQTTNAGLVGGGFGIEGALKGIIAATVINAATSKTVTNTFLRVATTKGEAHFHLNDIEPADLRMLLSPLAVAVEAKKFSTTRDGTKNIVHEIQELQKLKDAGVLTESEFSTAKGKLLSS